MSNTNDSSWCARIQCARLQKGVLALSVFSCAWPMGSISKNALQEEWHKAGRAKQGRGKEGLDVSRALWMSKPHRKSRMNFFPVPFNNMSSQVCLWIRTSEVKVGVMKDFANLNEAAPWSFTQNSEGSRLLKYPLLSSPETLQGPGLVRNTACPGWARDRRESTIPGVKNFLFQSQLDPERLHDLGQDHLPLWAFISPEGTRVLD